MVELERKLVELDDISILPTRTSRVGLIDRDKLSALHQPEPEIQKYYLPLFTYPSTSIVGPDSLGIFDSVGIRPIIPRAYPLQNRMEMLGSGLFVSFSMDEVIREIYNNTPFPGQRIRVNLDTSFGNYDQMIALLTELKKKYGEGIILMSGNVYNPETYFSYVNAGIDFVRVGFGEDPLLSNYGMYYPAASLVHNIIRLRKTMITKTVQKLPKIIFDGPISSHVDIFKLIGLGADYVMLGRELVKLVESSGTLYYPGEKGKPNIEKPVKDKSELDLTKGPYFREFKKTSSWDNKHITTLLFDEVEKNKGSWVKVNSNLSEWMEKFYDLTTFMFLQTGSVNFKEFSENISIRRVL